MKAIIFGASGQDGHYLSQLLAKKNIEVIGIDRHSDQWINGDISDLDFVDNLIQKNKPDYIFHFAAISSTKHSVLLANHKAIVLGTLNILESVKKHCPECKVFLSGSALQFENNGSPIDENTPFNASSAYALARIESVYAGRYYRDILGLKVYIGYFFNHESPLRSKEFVSQQIISAIKKIRQGGDAKLELGNIEVKKEFNFAGDIMEAVWLLVNQNSVSEAIIGSGNTYSIRDWVEYCFNKIGKHWEDYVTIQKDYTPDYKNLISNPKLIKSLGWQPAVGFSQLADMMMDYNR